MDRTLINPINLLKLETFAYSAKDLATIKPFIDNFIIKDRDNYGRKRFALQDIDYLKNKYVKWASEYEEFVNMINNSYNTTYATSIDYDELLKNILDSPKIGEIPSIVDLLSLVDFIMGEQQDFLKNIDTDKMSNSRWFVIAYLNKVPYGGIYLFRFADMSDNYFFQGIGKFHAPILFSILHPELKLPSLNSALIPFIEKFAIQNNHSNEISLYVSPINIQYKILTAQYGFLKLARDKFSEIIKGVKKNYLIPLGGNPVYKKITVSSKNFENLTSFTNSKIPTSFTNPLFSDPMTITINNVNITLSLETIYGILVGLKESNNPKNISVLYQNRQMYISELFKNTGKYQISINNIRYFFDTLDFLVGVKTAYSWINVNFTFDNMVELSTGKSITVL